MVTAAAADVGDNEKRVVVYTVYAVWLDWFDYLPSLYIVGRKKSASLAFFAVSKTNYGNVVWQQIWALRWGSGLIPAFSADAF